MSFSNDLEAKTLRHFLGGQTQTSPASLFVALYVSDPTESDTGTEVNGSGYVRQAVSFGSITTSGSKSVISNSNAVTFPQAGGNWGTVTHLGIRDGATGGNLLVYMPLPISKAIGGGDRMEFPIGSITIAID